MTAYKNFIEVGETQCDRHRTKLAYRYFQSGGADASLSFAALREDAIALAARLQAAGRAGDRAIIICPHGIDYVRALWGCLYSGLVAVPAYAPRNTHHFERLRVIVESAQARVVLLSRRQLSSVLEAAGRSGFHASTRWIVVDDPACEPGAAAWVPPTIEPEDTALLQYTSGSTTAARGVIVSHRNLIANQEMIRRAFGYAPQTVSVLWLPLFHDMGLIGLLQSVYTGFSSHLMSPLEFLSHPYRWLKAISDIGASATAAPDFAYRLCTEKITDEQLATLDLSSLVTAIDGAEPISATNLDAFAKRFARCGFRREALFPSYGLAEATLLVSGPRPDGPPRFAAPGPTDRQGNRMEVERVACGLPVDGCEVRIVDQRGRCCEAGQIGEIWVKGASVASGYWNNPLASQETFGATTADGAGPFLRTGDLGCLRDGEIVVTGRIKDLIIIRGVNYYPNDIEETAATVHPELTPNGCVSFLTDADELCVVAEIARGAAPPGLEQTIAGAVSEAYGIAVGRVMLVRPRTLPRTSSGKIQRSATKQALAQDVLHVVRMSVARHAPENAEPGGMQRLLAEADEDERSELVTGFLLGLAAEQLKIPFYRLSRQKSAAALGLDSIALIQLKQRMEAELGVELPAEILFADKTVQQLGLEILGAWHDGSRRSTAPLQTAQTGSFAATIGQVALWAVQQRDAEANSYNEGFVARIEGPLDLTCLQRSLQVLVDRHPALRTTFRDHDGQLWQDVAPAVAVCLRPETTESAGLALIAARRVLEAPFDLAREAWRCRVIRSPDASYLALSVHHIVFDMWSLRIFIDELTANYEKLLAKEALPFPAADMGAAWLDRARMQAEHASSEAGRRDLACWREALADAPATSRFPTSLPPRPASRSARRHRFVVPKSLVAQLREFGRTESLTLSQVLMSGFFLLLGKYTDQDDLVIGVPLLGRDSHQSLQALGYFVNLAPVRVRGIDQTDVLGLARKTQGALQDAQRGQAIPFGSLVEAWGPRGGDSWVQTSFSMISAELSGRPELASFILGMAGGRLALGEAVLHSCSIERKQAQFDLGCSLIESGEELLGCIEVRDELYGEGQIDRLIDSYLSLLGAMPLSARSKTRFVSAVGEKERRFLRRHLRRGSAGGDFAEADSHETVVERFRQTAARHPARMALWGPRAKRSYAELEEGSDRIARVLIGRGVRRADRVALAFTDRASQTIAALAVLKAAGIFVPLDLGHPAQRLSFYLRDARASLILADDESAKHLAQIAAAEGAAILLMHELEVTPATGAAASSPLPRAAQDDDIAYLIYTSGSTGTPKGVAVPHRGLTNLVRWHEEHFALDAFARASLVAGAAFDVAVWEAWPYLCTGGCLLEPPAAIKAAPNELARWIRDQCLTHSYVPTALAELMLDEPETPDLGELRFLFTAGDRLRVRARRNTSYQLINAYGPTENAVITTAGAVASAEVDNSLPDIGEPIRNQDLHILDRHGNEVPAGISGELYIGGHGLAREYHRQPGRTAERFVPNSFGGEPGSRLYASGDLVRLDENGRIHFIARNDDQVKIRGHRVELGEIEATLLRHPAIRQCKVVLQDSPKAGRWIAAYLCPTCKTDETSDDATLRKWLEERLPGYMIPAAFAWLDKLRVDANGKIDRKQLPPMAEPDGGPRAFAPFAAPFEEEIAQLYADTVGIARVGRDDDFFALGGHSLLAGKLVQQVHARLGTVVPMATVFAHPRVHEFAALVRASRQAQVRHRLPTQPRPALVPLSSAQTRLWFLHRLDPESTDYSLTVAVHIRGDIDLHALEATFQKLVDRHEVLRTRFVEREGTPYQDVLPSWSLPLECLTIDAPAYPMGDDAANRILQAWEAEPFCLSQGPPLRTRLIRTASDEGWLFIGIHHIIADGRTLQILLREASSFYRSARAGLTAQEPSPPLQYADYTLSCLTDEAQTREAVALCYWKEHLAELPPRLSIPSLPAAGVDGTPAGDEARQPLPASLVEQVRSLAAASKTTEFSVYLATLSLLLGKTSGENRFLIGIAYEGRNLPEWQDVAGFFVNVLPILVVMPESGDFRALLDLVRIDCAQAMKHSDASYEKIVHAVRPGGDTDLIQAMFDFEQFTPERIDFDDVQTAVASRVDTSAKFELTFRCRLTPNGATIALNYRRTRYGRLLAESLLASYIALLRQIVAHPDTALAALRLVDDEAAARLLQAGAGPARLLPSASVVQRFEAAARAHPGRLALVGSGDDDDGQEHLTYGEVNARANRLARLLRDKGLAAGGVGVICLAPGPPFVISALAILKLSAAYAAIDPRYPLKRRNAILDDCRASILVTDDEAQAASPRSSTAVLLWSELCRRLDSGSADDLETHTTAEDPVYLVYTSGTTGTPKGVVIPERGLANLCQWHSAAYSLEDGRDAVRAAQTAGIGFDAAVWEIWPYLLSGASVWFAPAEARTSAREIARWLTEARITHAFVATPLAHELLGDGWRGSADLKVLLTGGDRLTARAPRGASYRLINHYGPSEHSVVATAGAVAEAGARPPSIGRPIDNVQALVLDRDRQLVPAGIAGELYLAGSSLLSAYRNDPDMTARSLVVNPYAPDGARMYRTGDRVCWNEDGELEYLGRLDDQVKIRGFRIEPAEIVLLLAAQPQVQSAAVKLVEHPTSGWHLAAYVVLRAGAVADADELKNELARSLPAFMVPSFIVMLDSFPLTSNGKVDTARLPAPAWDAGPLDRPLETPTEHAIGAIWSELLGTSVNNAGANFFALGGHSLLATRAVAAIENRLTRECSLPTFLAAPTLAALARKVDAESDYLPIPRARLRGRLPISPLQRRLWLMQDFAPENADYNVVGAIEIEGTIEPASLKLALRRLVERHGILRTRIETIDAEPGQQVTDAAALDEAFFLRVFAWEDLRGSTGSEHDRLLATRIAALAREAYDLQQGPLFRLDGLQVEEHRVVLAASVHHILVDGWSIQILLRDLVEIYRSIIDGTEAVLPHLPVAYTDYSIWAARRLRDKQPALLAFWTSYLRDLPPAARLPGRPQPQAAAATGETISLALGEETSAGLRALARERHASLFELLYALHIVWLHQLTRSTDLVVGTPFHQRGRPELENVAGFFVNILPVRSRFARSSTFRQLLDQVRKDLAEVQAHGELPFERIAEHMATTGEEPLYRTIFDLRQDPPFEARLTNFSVKTRVQHVDAPLSDLAVTLAQGENGLTWSCTFRSERFSASMIESWAEDFRAVAGCVLQDDEQPIRDVQARGPQGWLAPAAVPGETRSEETLLIQLARQVAVHPNRPALTTAEETFSFIELELASNQIAHYLRAQGIRPGTPVGLETRHCLDSILIIVAIMKIGGLYVPVDTELPEERLRKVIADAGCQHLLAQRPLPGFSGRFVSTARACWQDCPRHMIGISVVPDHPVYLAYTSGTTGEPKASVLSHRGIVNYVGNARERFRVEPQDRFLLFAPLSFDASLEEIFVPLCSGASLHVGPPESKRSLAALIELCCRAEITVLTLPTAYWRLLAEHVATAPAAMLPTVRLISIGGEMAPLSTVRRWNELADGRIALWNIYGPSECSIGCIMDRLDGGSPDGSDVIPLRHPITDATLHVLDDHLDPVPAWVDGEVYVGGVGLAHGYHGRPALTAERFMPDPFGKPGSRMYRTGDLARMDRAGGLQLLGRADFQTKIDGMRVELEDVESSLERHPAVGKAIVVPRRMGAADNHLIAYVTLADRSAEASPAALLADLRRRLPAYMVPAALHVLDEFPLTVNQKVDRAALSDLAAQPRLHEPSATETEALLLAIWRELLPDTGFGVSDDLFSLGAGSLLLIRLITRIDSDMHVRLTVRDIFEHPTIRQLARLVDRRLLLSKRTGGPIPRIDRSEVALSGAQARLWYLQQIAKESSAYHVPNCLRLEGRLQPEALLAAIRTTVAQNESLRTVFRIHGDAPMQVVRDNIEVELREHDLQGAELADAAASAAELGLTLLEQPFDLEQGPLCRFHLIRIRPELHVLVTIFHHIIVDGWSVQLWNQQLAHAYNRALDGGLGTRAGIIGTERALQYRDFSEWQHRLLDEAERLRQLAYWDGVLGGDLPTLGLPLDFVRPAQPGDAGAIRAFRVDDQIAARLSSLARQQHASLFMVLLSAYFCLLCRYCNQTDILVGIPALGRDREELNDIIGFFVNTLVIRCDLRRNMPFADLLSQVKAVCLDAFDHQDIPLEEIASRANAFRRAGRSEIFQTMLSFHEGGRTGAEELRGLAVGTFELSHRTSKFDLHLAMWTTDEGLAGAFEFRTELFAADTIVRMSEHFQNLLESIVTAPSSAIGQLQLLSWSEHDRLVHAHDGAVLRLPANALAHQLFELQAAANPVRLAVTDGNESLTYAELNRRANLVAHELIDRGARPEDRVVLLLERDAAYLVALLACLKSGTAFVPMDPNYPAEKMASIVRQSAARGVIVGRRDRNPIAGMQFDLGIIDMADTQSFWPGAEHLRARNPDVALTGRSLAYVIYTSGSTGMPKGAMIEHRGMLNHLLSKVHALGLTGNDVVAEMAATTFDVSIWQYLVAVLVGGRTAVIRGDTAWLPRELLPELDRQGVTIFESVPSHMKVILDELETRPDGYPLPHLRTYISNAEALAPPLCRRWLARLPHVPLVNTYGATECSDDTSHLIIDTPPSDELPYIPIDGTLPNLTTYVLDELMQPIPVGVTGEVYIGGIGVGRGYVNDPVHTAAAYVPDPFASEPGKRFYKTGDMARLRPSGAIEFLGRSDFQVKIRGQRVELGEIEAALRAHEWLRDVLVTAASAQRGGLYLLAYVVPARHPAPAAQELQSFLRARLPDYMIPAAFVFLDAFPLNNNGKVDRKNLPALSQEELSHGHAFVPPGTDTERELVKLWASLLDVDLVGVLDGFFELGGHSLLAAELMIKIRNRFGIDLPLKEIFENPTVRGLGALIDGRFGARPPSHYPALRRYPARPRYDLAPCQIPEWYAYQVEPESPVYNICICDLFLHGELDRHAFLRAWQSILDRHDVLHVRFGYHDGKPFQSIDRRVALDEQEVFWDRRYLRTDDEIMAEANRLASELGVAPFDFEKGPLFRLHLVSYGTNRHQLIFVVHHIIWDETSLLNLTAELGELYNAYRDGRPPEVPELKASYFDYVQWMHEAIESGALEASKQYWLDLYRTAPPPLDLPTDRPRPDLMTYRGDAIETWLPRAIVRKQEAFRRRNGVTLFMLQLALLDHYIYLMTGQDDFVIGCPIAGRSHPDFKPLLGLFATPMPIRCNIGAGMTFRELLRHVSSRTLDAFDHFQYPSNQLIEQVCHQKDLSRPKLFSVMFGVQNDKTNLVNELSFQRLEISFEDVIDTENKSSRFDLNFVVDQFGSDIKFSCIYNTDLFHRDTVALLLENMTALLDAVLDDPDKPLHSYGFLLPNEALIRAIEEGPSLAVEAEATMHSGLERQAARTPDRLATVMDGDSCTYRELDDRANRLAQYLRSLGIGPGDTIAVLHEPSIEMIVSLYAVLKSGACYVPIAPDYPQSRMTAILRDTGARAVLTTSEHEHHFANIDAELILVNSLVELLACYVAETPPAVAPDTLAYILYTSGSTGRPRGIQIEHRGVANMLAAMQHEYTLNEDDRVLFHTPYTFDVAVQEVFWPLSVGATVVIAPGWLLKAAREIASLIERQSVTFVQFVPVMLQALVDARKKRTVSTLPSLRQVICGGAALSKALKEDFQAAFSAPLANHYGPSEVTVDAARFDCRRQFIGDSTPIGRPIANTRILVLNAEGERVPRGIIGEIHVASPGLARGYVNDAARTERCFVEVEVAGTRRRVYRTGDLGRYDRDGLLHFHGRRDRQVKVRGNRVEIDEVVGVLSSHPDVAVAAVRAVKDGHGDDRLVAFVEPWAEGLVADRQRCVPLSPASVRDFLRLSLPEYMIPEVIQVVPSIAKTESGKVDENRLPEVGLPTDVERRSVETLIQRELAAIMQQILGIAGEIGIRDDFFVLGGQSLKAVELISEVNERYGSRLDLRKFYKEPTIECLERLLTESGYQGARRVHSRP